MKEKDSAALAIAIARFSQVSVFTVKGVSPKRQIVTQFRETYLERELIRAYLHRVRKLQEAASFSQERGWKTVIQ